MKTTREEIEVVVKNFAGEEVLNLARYLKNKKSVSELDIAEEIGCELNVARSMLYKLHRVNLVSSVRKRDEERGLYVHYWSFKKLRVPELLETLKRRKLEKLKNTLDSEVNGLYFECKKGCATLDFDQAVNFQYRCPECGLLMNQKENSKSYLKTLRKEIKQLQKEIE